MILKSGNTLSVDTNFDWLFDGQTYPTLVPISLAIDEFTTNLFNSNMFNLTVY